MDNPHEPKGLSGWLLVFILINLLAIFIAIGAVWDPELIGIESSNSATLNNILIISTIAGVALSLGIIFTLSTNLGKPNAVAIVINLIWLEVILSIGVQILLWFFAGSYLTKRLVVSEIACSFFYAKLWTLYFKNAVRVQNTYGTPPSKDKDYRFKIIVYVIIMFVVLLKEFYIISKFA